MKQRIAYLIGQYPAIGHGYLIEEIQELERLGWQIARASVSLPDRAIYDLSPTECLEREITFYVKEVSIARAVYDQLLSFLRAPAGYCGAFFWILGKFGTQPRR